MPKAEPSTVPREIGPMIFPQSSRDGSNPFTRVTAAERVASCSRFETISARPNMPMAMTTKPMPSASCGKPRL